ncbi:urease accessory protein UreF [Aquicoccus porphyridii]|uniref:Urease accessory protein UreF n=1 Tax=Aquicoccus porphyridii TaxID=1852029 RepID=A0A5A9YYT2_9RHOB|nr:urease accessory protein UreF [Aquicoccus porphyridii]RAI53461.1 urease accessory protein UreF [Rhodobacteraceae bacterium AsT-22]
MLTPAHLTLVQWLSPAFPTGAFAYSHGLEHEIATGAVRDANSLEQWLTNILRFGAGWQDAVLLAHALTGDCEVLDDLARALQPCAERLQEGLEQGSALARTVAAITGRPLPPRMLPIALGEAASALDLPAKDVIALYLQGFAGNLVTIAIRHVPLGQTEGQAVLHHLAPLIHTLANDAATAPLNTLGTCALAGDLAALRHATQEVRIFRT